MNRRTIRLFAAAVAATSLLAALPAFGYSMIQATSTGRVTSGNLVSCSDSGGFAHWSKSVYTNIQWRLNTSGQGSGKAAAIQAAANTWTNVSGADHVLNYSGTTSADWSTDGNNTILFASGNGCTGSCLALTALVMQSGQLIVESDVTFNANYTWNTNGSDYDTQAVMTHEFGHPLGLHHSSASGNPTMQGTYFGTGGRTLEADDRAALRCSQNRYGAKPPTVTVSGPTSRNPNQSGTWTCGVSGGTAPYTRSWFKATQSGITNLGSGSSQSTSDTQSFNIVCDVVDAAGKFGTDYVFVDVDGDPGFPPLPF